MQAPVEPSICLEGYPEHPIPPLYRLLVVPLECAVQRWSGLQPTPPTILFASHAPFIRGILNHKSVGTRRKIRCEPSVKVISVATVIITRAMTKRSRSIA